jgi:hypothetical protein
MFFAKVRSFCPAPPPKGLVARWAHNPNGNPHKPLIPLTLSSETP